MQNSIKVKYTDINGQFKVKKVTPLQLSTIKEIAPDLRII